MKRFGFTVLGLVSVAAFAEIGPNTIMDEVPGDTTLSNLVAAAGATPVSYATISNAAMTALQSSATNGFVTASVTNGLRSRDDLRVYTKAIPQDGWIWSSANAELLAALNHSGSLPYSYGTQTTYWDIQDNPPYPWRQDGEVIADAHTNILTFSFNSGAYFATATYTLMTNSVPTDDMIATTSGVVKAIAAIDLSGYAGKQELTNVVREVAGQVWDAPLSVTWGLVAENGCFSFVAVTNTNTTILGE